MPKTDLRELDQRAALRESRRHLPDADPRHAGVAQDLEPIVQRELSAATQGLSGPAADAAKTLRQALAEARKAEDGLTSAYDVIGKALPSDRQELRKRADALSRGHTDAYAKAEAAAAVLEAELTLAAIPPVPDDAADAKDELRMLLEGKATREKVLEIAMESRYAGLMAGTFGKTWLRANGSPIPHDALREAIAAKYGRGKQATAARKAIAAARAVGSHRLRASGVDR